MQQDFAEALNQAGLPSDRERVPPEVCDTFRSRVPSGLIEFWTEVGWCSFQEGYFWICDPRPFAGLLEGVFGGDPEYDASEFVIFKYDAFGKLYGWSERSKLMMLDIAAYKPVFSSQGNEVRPGAEAWTDDRVVANSIAVAEEEREYFADNDLNDFERALLALGPLRQGEIYAYNPSFALGGGGAPETLVKAPVVEHLLLVSQLVKVGVEKYILDPTDAGNPMGRFEKVRVLGAEGSAR